MGYKASLRKFNSFATMVVLSSREIEVSIPTYSRTFSSLAVKALRKRPLPQPTSRTEMSSPQSFSRMHFHPGQACCRDLSKALEWSA